MQETRPPIDKDAHIDEMKAEVEALAGSTNPWRFARSFAIGLAVYILIIAGYVFLLRLFREPLLRLYDERLTVYAWVALGLIVVQGIVLESVTNLLAEHLGIVLHEE